MSFTYERNWSFSFNNLYTPTSNTDDPQYALWAIKAMLLGQLGGLSSGLWTTYYSCNGVTAGTPGDGVDRWGSTYTPANILYGAPTAAHSWYVLKSPLMNGYNFYILISYGVTYDLYITLLMSKNPFSGGSTTANPTASPSWSVIQSNSYLVPGNTTLHRYNMCLSSTGDFIFFIVIAGMHYSYTMLSAIAPVGCHPLDQYPIFSFGTVGGTIPQAGVMQGTPAANYEGNIGTNNAMLALRTYQSVGTGTDLLSGKLLDLPIKIIAANSYGWAARGRLPDMLYCGFDNSAIAPTSGQTILNQSSQVVAVTNGSFVIPANASPDFS